MKKILHINMSTVCSCACLHVSQAVLKSFATTVQSANWVWDCVRPRIYNIANDVIKVKYSPIATAMMRCWILQLFLCMCADIGLLQLLQDVGYKCIATVMYMWYRTIATVIGYNLVQLWWFMRDIELLHLLWLVRYKSIATVMVYERYGAIATYDSSEI